MFDITGAEISLLSDDELRELIGRLCEAELRRNGISALAVQWGGNQNARDGGIDVRIASANQMAPGSGIPRRNVGYQVKAQDMSRTKILSEMRPGGSLRPAISELAEQSGAYIIVSSKGSVTQSALRERRQAMRDAVQDSTYSDALFLDFYDRDRLATWVRDFSGIVLWTREKLGRPVAGWRPYDDWANSNEGTDERYLLDDAIRVQGPDWNGQVVSALQGIVRIRSILSNPRGIVRLVGLSGTGKTRLVQALFDERLGQGLAPELAVYTNLSDDPAPQPVEVATELVAQRRRQILIIDNCPPELHNRLSEICRKTDSELSLITVEYDVRDNQPEGTDAFELQPSSDNLIERLLLRRVEGLSQVNAQSIAHFSNGNARVALALASTVERGESIADLRDPELFERLFRQRNDSSGSLLLSAQVCSLAYSFQGEDTPSGEDAELVQLASAVGKDTRSLHADIAELRRRDLIQARGVWRALLPHAIANHLAALALDNILPQDFLNLTENAPPRLLRSISRRLGYLHTSEAAQRIACGWLADDGLLGKVEKLNGVGKAMLANIAPISPSDVLEAIGRTHRRQRTQGSTLDGEEFRVLLLSLAFDAELFDRAVALLVDLIEFEPSGGYANQVRNSFPSLFHLYLSGTHATVQQRIAVIDGLLLSDSVQRQELGLAALGAMSQSSHFSSFQSFAFGARSRDYGYFPRKQDEITYWFKSVLELCVKHDGAGGTNSVQIRKILAEKMNGLWHVASLREDIAETCHILNQKRFWPEGLAAIRSIRYFRKDPVPETEEKQIAAIEEDLAPGCLPDIVRAYVLKSVREAYDDIDLRNFEANTARRERRIIEIGHALASDRRTLSDLLPELVACDTGLTLGPLARGLVDAVADRRDVWSDFVSQFKLSVARSRSTELLACYLYNLQSTDPDLTETLLNESLEDPQLSEWYPVLQTRVRISIAGLERLKQSLKWSAVPAERFGRLAYAGPEFADESVLECVRLILVLKDGFRVALDIIWMRIAIARRDHSPISTTLLAAGRLVLSYCEFDRDLRHDTHALEEVIVACLATPENAAAVETMIGRLRVARFGYTFGFIETNSILSALFTVHPLTCLRVIFESGRTEDERIAHGMFDRDEHVGSPLDAVPEATMLRWCNEDPDRRYNVIASAIVPFTKQRNTDVAEWKSISLALLDCAPDPIQVLRNYIDHLYPMGWVGSRATVWAMNVRLLEELRGHRHGALAAFAQSEHARLTVQINELKQAEFEAERRENERFE